jgi:hypothetical protein
MEFFLYLGLGLLVIAGCSLIVGWVLVEESALTLAAVTFLLGLVFMAIGSIGISMREDTAKEADCASRHGVIMHGGRYGDDACIVDGRIAKVYG